MGDDRGKELNVNRRQFLQYSSAAGVFWTVGGILPSCVQAPPKPVPERAIPGGLRIIDPALSSTGEYFFLLF